MIKSTQVFYTRAVACVLLLILSYVVVGEFVQGWSRLYLDAWAERKTFGSEADRQEWRRVSAVSALALTGWPWKTSLYKDAAILQLHAARGEIISRAEAGRAILQYGNAFAAWGLESPEIVTLQIQGGYLSGNLTATRLAVEKLKKLAPFEREYWNWMMIPLAQQALSDASFQPLARDVIAYYADWDGIALAQIAKRSIPVMVFLPKSFSPKAPASHTRRLRRSSSRP